MEEVSWSFRHYWTLQKRNSIAFAPGNLTQFYLLVKAKPLKQVSHFRFHIALFLLIETHESHIINLEISLKTYIPFCILLLFAPFLHSQTRVDLSMFVDSVQRRYIVSIPTGSVPVEGYPLVFVFHPSAHNGATMYNTSKWTEKGEAQNILTVFPTALEYCVNDEGTQKMQTKWHIAELEEKACPGQYLKDDLHFVTRMLDTLTRRFPVNTRRIYATGFSNGAGFSAKLAVQMSEVFSAVGYSGANLYSGDSIKPARAVPMWFVLGTQDSLWVNSIRPYGYTEIPFNDSALMFLSGNINRVLGCENLIWNYQKTATARQLTYIFNTPASAEPAYEFRYSLIKNMGHEYPNGINVPFVAADIFWDFFNQYQKPATVNNQPLPPAELDIYPNPTKEFFMIPGEGEVVVTLRNILGQKIFSSQGQKGTRIQLPHHLRGMYIAEILSGKKLSIRKVIIH